jgi:Acetyltransferases, including N-acetylases of ribosomal proteins
VLSFQFNPFPVIETERLRLRAITLEDLPWLRELRTDAEVQEYIKRPKESMERTKEVLGQMIDNVTNNEAIAWVITIKTTGAVVGTIGLWQIDKYHHKGEIGYMSFKRYWNKGIISEALKPVVDYGFRVMKLHRIEGEIEPGNIASGKVLEKLGFEREAYYKEDYYFEGKFFDSARYGLITPYK